MSKKILAIYYSQTGQLGDIINNFTAPFVEAGVSVEKVIIHPKDGISISLDRAAFFFSNARLCIERSGRIATFYA